MTSFPTLDVVRIDELSLHETEDRARTAKLEERIKADGFQKNPVIVGLISGVKRNCLLLDGVHRISALRNLGCIDTVAQVVDYQDDDVRVEAWNQSASGATPEILLRKIKQTVGKDLKRETEDRAMQLRRRKKILVHILLANGGSYVVKAPENLEARTAKIKSILDACASVAKVNRLYEDEANYRLGKPWDATAIVFMTTFEKEEIVQMASSKVKLPAGITRHIIPYRALGLSVDLAFLKVRSQKSEKSKLIQQIVKERIDGKRVRFYAEPVYVFDE